MERLTIDTDIRFCDIAQCSETPGGSFCEDGYCDQRRCYERLREYERLGTIADLTDLAKARDEGRVVVLDEPCKPLIWGDAEHNSLLCPCCKTDLVGLLYGNRAVLQCPECGQYVDEKAPVSTYKSRGGAERRGKA